MVKKIWLASLVLVFFSGLAYSATSPKVVMAKVGNHEITVAEFMQFVSKDASRVRQVLNPAGKAALLRELIERHLLYQAMRKEGLLPEKPDAKDFKRAYLRLMKEHFPRPEEIPEGELRAYYEKHKERYGLPELVRVSQILFRVPKDATEKDWEEAHRKAEEALRRLKAGEPFEKLAEALTENPRAKANKGDVGFLPLHADPWLEKAVSGIEVGEHTGVLKSSVGYEILKVTDHRDPMLLPFEEVRELVERDLKKARQEEARKRYIKGLAKAFGVTIYMEELKDAMP